MTGNRQLTIVLLTFCLMLAPLSAVAQMPTVGLDAPRLFEKGMNALTGLGESHNDRDAADFFRRSADLGYAPAQVVLGYFYETGTIVTQEPAQAAEWYRRASKQDDRLGDWLLGRLYYTGTGLPRDLDQAALGFQKAASQGDPYGQYLLGMVKLERNEYAKAADWFRRASMQGMPQAQQQLGQLLRQGRQDVTVDKFEAYVWFLVSFNAGNQAVASDLQQLEGELSSAQVGQAKTKARDLEQTVTRAVVARGCTGWPGEFSAVPAPPPVDLQTFCR
jgi:TPR repeat protein